MITETIETYAYCRKTWNGSSYYFHERQKILHIKPMAKIGVVDSGGTTEARVTWGTLTPPGKYDWTVRVRRRCGLMSNYFDLLLGRLLRVDLITLEGKYPSVSRYVRTYVRTYVYVRAFVHKKFFRFQWNLVCRQRSMTDARRYAVWPDPRSRSRSRSRSRVLDSHSRRRPLVRHGTIFIITGSVLAPPCAASVQLKGLVDITESLFTSRTDLLV